MVDTKKIYLALKIIISLSLISLLFYLRRDTLGLTIETIKRLKPQLFVFSCLLFALSAAVLAVRFRLILCTQGLFLKLSEVLNLVFIGYFFNNFLPTAIGGDVVKAYYTSKKTDNKFNSFFSVFVDRFIGFLSLFILAGMSLIFNHRNLKMKVLIWVTISILFALLVIAFLLFNKRLLNIFRPMAHFHNAVSVFRDKKGLILQSILISFAAQILSFFVIYLLSKGMGAFIPLKMVLLFMPLVAIASMLPSINGLGIRESAIYFLFGPYVGYKNAFALSILWLFMFLFASFIGGIAYLFGAQYKAKIGV